MHIFITSHCDSIINNVKSCMSNTERQVYRLGQGDTEIHFGSSCTIHRFYCVKGKSSRVSFVFEKMEVPANRRVHL